MFEKTWGPGKGEAIYFADELANGDFILIGETLHNPSQQGPSSIQAYMCRLDRNGNLLWEKTYGDTNRIGIISTIKKAVNGTYLVVGSVSSSTSDIWLLNLDENGGVVFDDQLSYGAIDVGISACELPDNTTGFFFVVSCSLDGGSYTIPALWGISPSGQQLGIVAAAPNDFLPRFIQRGPDGFIVVGQASSACRANTYVEKFQNSGSNMWIKYPYGLNDTVSNEPQQLFTHSDGTFDIAFMEGAASGDIHWKSFDASGNELNDVPVNFPLRFTSMHNAGPPVKDELNGMNISVSDATEIFEIDSAGKTYLRASLQADSSGKTFYYAIRTSDNGYLATGSFLPPQNFGTQFYLAKFSATGRIKPETFLKVLLYSQILQRMGILHLHST